MRLWVRDTLDAARRADGRSPARSGRKGRDPCRRGDAGLHPSAIGAAGHLRPSPARLCRDAGARPRPHPRCARAAERMPARRGRARRHLLPDRPAHDGEGARLRPADGEFARFGLGSRFRAGDARGGLDLRHASVAAGRGDRALGDAAIRLRQALRQVLDRLLDHAAEAQSRCGRAGARQGRARLRGAAGAC